MKLARIQAALFVAQLAAVYTLARASVALFVQGYFYALSTVLAAALMMVGSVAALRGRTWGVGVTFMCSVGFTAAAFLKIGPPWFYLVGLAGAIPMALGLRAFATFGRDALLLFAGGAATIGASVALAWRAFM